MITEKKIFELLESIKDEVALYLAKLKVPKENITKTKKSDDSIVTEVDTFISNLFKEKFMSHMDAINFFSEEDQGEFHFPMIILDPIDGTRELANGIDECVISFGIYYSADLNDERNFSWIYNPFTGFEIHSCFNLTTFRKAEKNRLISFVSNTEYENGYYVDNHQISFFPKGSIAYKLGLLAAGAGDLVISKKDKNIWDIIAGTHICFKRGIFLRQNSSTIFELKEKLIQADLVWCTDDIYNKVVKSFQN